MKKFNYRKSILAISIFLLMPLVGFAQSYNASGLSMGGAYGAVAKGIEAMNWNPANLALPRPNQFELNFIGLNATVSNSSMTLANYERYFTKSGNHGHWDDNDIEAILNLIPDDGLKATGEVNFNTLAMVFGNYGFSVQLMGQVLGVSPKAPLVLFLKGNQTLNKEFRFDDIDASGFSAVKTTFSASIPIPIKKYFDIFTVGANFNYFYGLAIAEKISSDGSLFVGSENIISSMNIRARKALGGSGFGMDIGAAGIIKEDITISLVLKNVIGNIEWSKEQEEIFTSYEMDSLTISNLDDFETEQSDTTFPIGKFSTTLPPVFHLGVAYQLNEDLLLSMDFEQAFDNKMGYTNQGLFAIGTQYYPVKFLPLRTGMTFGGKYGYAFGMGFGLHFPFFQFDLGYSMHRALWPTYSTGISFAFNMKFLL